MTDMPIYPDDVREHAAACGADVPSDEEAERIANEATEAAREAMTEALSSPNGCDGLGGAGCDNAPSSFVTVEHRGRVPRVYSLCDFCLDEFLRTLRVGETLGRGETVTVRTVGTE